MKIATIRDYTFDVSAPYPIEVNGLTRIEPSPFRLANAQGLAYANVKTREGSNGSARTLLLFINGNERKYVLRNMDKDILGERKREKKMEGT